MQGTTGADMVETLAQKEARELRESWAVRKAEIAAQGAAQMVLTGFPALAIRIRPSTLVTAGIETEEGAMLMPAVMVVAMTERMGQTAEQVVVELQATDLLAVSRERLPVEFRRAAWAWARRRVRRLALRVVRPGDKRLQQVVAQAEWLPLRRKVRPRRDRVRLLLEAQRLARSLERRRRAQADRRKASAKAGDPLTEFV